ncbi:Hypothetical protein FKW44_006156 [Caligus rogercresseyi]|uniref:Uncharacterized protein n=1 Tax=Caligus rogercresseyi TaxID=217165 RepID=A0A7T8KD17_CALRO|nr:Hypothetical protein FKW44_006156 [Caligus rogercresseyi]
MISTTVPTIIYRYKAVRIPSRFNHSRKVLHGKGQERSGKNLSTGTIMPSPALYRPKYAMGGCQRPFMFLEASGPPGIVLVLPLATPSLVRTLRYSADLKKYVNA